MVTGESPLRDHLRRFKAEVFQGLAHPTRIAIVELLRDETSVSVSRICEQLGLEQANVSQHLAVLRSKQIVVSRKDGNQVFYSLRDPFLGKILNLIQKYSAGGDIAPPKLDKLGGTSWARRSGRSPPPISP